MPLLGGMYFAWSGHGVLGILVRGLAAGICLLPPTLLMGATLPAIARWVESTPEGVSWLGFFYGGNIAGAVLGCLLAGLLPAARLRRGGGDLRRRRAERDGRGPGADHRTRDPARGGTAAGQGTRDRAVRRARGPSTSPSRSPA